MCVTKLKWPSLSGVAVSVMRERERERESARAARETDRENAIKIWRDR